MRRYVMRNTDEDCTKPSKRRRMRPSDSPVSAAPSREAGAEQDFFVKSGLLRVLCGTYFLCAFCQLILITLTAHYLVVFFSFTCSINALFPSYLLTASSSATQRYPILRDTSSSDVRLKYDSSSCLCVYDVKPHGVGCCTRRRRSKSPSCQRRQRICESMELMARLQPSPVPEGNGLVRLILPQFSGWF